MPDTSPSPGPGGRETGAALLAAGGLAAAFGAAACCALPALPGALGLGGAWLFGLALLAGPHRTLLLAAAAVCLAGAALLLWRRRRTDAATACAPGAACPARPALRRLAAAGLLLGTVLLAPGYAYA
ncbi:mercuric transporter MerT family protein [Caldovatus aquaticus]|uniref:Mercuric transport protein MerT n=1 Tax=Caldovatus aquaticus TaxID=2865671 RepID=A0ABS7F2A4_9PROT|nr:mercuric transporter MerT family protein [Caldovatus aquaticus]MBW8269629.1 mercuric reductase [Caldovatus aquaticus]